MKSTACACLLRCLAALVTLNMFTEFADEFEVQVNRFESDSVANFWQFGLAIGRPDERLKFWRLEFDRLGLAYNYSATGELRGIKFVFRSLYDL